jgi:hypothetical protein
MCGSSSSPMKGCKPLNSLSNLPPYFVAVALTSQSTCKALRNRNAFLSKIPPFVSLWT